jgi:hypothetical protein
VAGDPVPAQQLVRVPDHAGHGTIAVGSAAISASAGTCIAAMPKRTWSAAVLVVAGSRPEASV